MTIVQRRSLAMTDMQVARLTRPEREKRVVRLMAESRRLYRTSVRRHIEADGKTLVGTVILFSGGNDSTVLAHLFKDIATHAAHANTGIGIEQTREFVRNTCAAWDLPLIEKYPREQDSFRAMVLSQGFPGPGHHYKAFQRLKERQLRQVRAELVKNGRRECVVFLAGRRRQESERRANIPEMEREGAVVWCSPLVNWTKLDLTTYRLMHAPVPVNEVSDLIHMSGECLCGSFAKKDELDEISMWFPEVRAEIEALEAEIADRDDIKPHAKRWGWGGDPEVLKASRTKSSKSGRLCSSCDARHEGGEIIKVPA